MEKRVGISSGSHHEAYSLNTLAKDGYPEMDNN